MKVELDDGGRKRVAWVKSVIGRLELGILRGLHVDKNMSVYRLYLSTYMAST